jgi:hypothetical protein
MEISIEEVRALFFDKTALTPPPYKLFQLNWGGRRYYYKFDDNGEAQFYDGVTSVIKNTIPESEGIKQWRNNLGKEESERVMNERALYGTLMHTCFTRLLIDRVFDLDQIPDVVKMYCEKNDHVNEKTWVKDLQEDIAAFTMWIIDCGVKPLLIEIPLLDEELSLGGMVDLVATITVETKGYHGEVYKTGVNSGKPKETKVRETITAIVDYKSNRSGSFYLNSQLQLGCYERMVRSTFPQFSKVRTFNWSPKNWRTEPGYNFVEQTNRYDEEVYFSIRTLHDVLNSDVNNKFIINCNGLINLQNNDPLLNVVNKVNIQDYVIRKDKKTRPAGKNHATDSGLSENRGEGGIQREDNSALNGLL